MGQHLLLPNFVTTALLGLLALSVAVTTQAATFQCGVNWVVPGTRLRTYRGYTPRTCQSLCEGQSRCQYFTYWEDINNTANTTCWLLADQSGPGARDNGALVTCSKTFETWVNLAVPEHHVGNTGTFIPTSTSGLYSTAAYSTGVIAIHATLLPNTNKVLLFGRPQDFANYPPQPGMGIPGTDPYVSYAAAIVDIGTGKAAPVTSDAGAPFCANQIHLSNGQILICGGDDQYIGHPGDGPWGGYKSCRIFRQVGGVWRWEQFGDVLGGHWYPNIVELPPNVGGSTGTCGLVLGGVLNVEGDVPTHASMVCPDMNVLFSIPVEDMGNEDVQDELRTKFPGVILLPVGAPGDKPLLALMNYRTGNLVQLDSSISSKRMTLNSIKKFPEIPIPESFMASNIVPLAFDLANGEVKPEDVTLMVFGGDSWNWMQPAVSVALRINPLAEDPQWTTEAMPSEANYRSVVMLPNGKMVLIGGGRIGLPAGGPTCCSSAAAAPILQAWIYDPYAPAGSRFTVDPMMSPHTRFYHSSAWLGVDGRVFIGGTDQTIEPEYRPSFNMEAYTPLTWRRAQSSGAKRPDITGLSNNNFNYGKSLTVRISNGFASRCSLIKPAAVTHANAVNQRVVILKTVLNQVDPVRGEGYLFVETPKSMFMAPPGLYLLYCWNGDMYSIGRWVNLRPVTPKVTGAGTGPGPLTKTLAVKFAAGV